MTNTTQINNLYGIANGTNSTSPFVDIFETRAPTGNDTAYPVQKKWFNPVTGDYYILQGFTSLGGVVQAIWKLIGSVENVQSLTGNSGGPVLPTADNTNVVGDGTYITVVGNPATSTLTIESAGALAILYTENTGTATPATGNLNVLGGTGIATTGSGSTITINAAGSTPLTFDCNTGSAIASSNVLNVLGSSGITTSGSGSTITISGTSEFSSVHVQVFTTSGTYTPTSGMLYCTIEVVGGGGGGGGSASTAATEVSVGGAGGGGGYARKTVAAATIGASKTVTIGALGAGGVGSNPGGTGGTTSVGAIVSATGGVGGAAGTAISASSWIAAPGAAGGAGSSGDFNTTGNPGNVSFAFYYTALTQGLLLSGTGGSSFFGGAGLGAPYPSGNGGSATSYGGGGGGALSTTSNSAFNGGAGVAGIVVITEYV